MLGCKSVKYIPVETTKTRTEYVDRFKTDSIHVRDSVFVLVKGDTVFKTGGEPCTGTGLAGILSM